MLNVRVMNSVGASKAKNYPETTTILNIMDDPDMSNILVGVGSLMWNSTIVAGDDYSKTIGQLGGHEDRVNVLAAIKAANGASK